MRSVHKHVFWQEFCRLASVQLVEQRLRLLQIGGIEPLGEPAVDGGPVRCRRPLVTEVSMSPNGGRMMRRPTPELMKFR